MFKRLFRKTDTVEHTLKEPLTIVVMLVKPYDYRENKRDRQLMKHVAQFGAKVIFINPDEGQDAAILRPMKNVLVVKPGIDARPHFEGRIVMFTAHPQHSPTLQTAHPNLIIFDDRDKYPAIDRMMIAEIASIAINETAVPSTDLGAKTLLSVIETLPNRKPPRT